jgi:hypothetical protein
VSFTLVLNDKSVEVNILKFTYTFHLGKRHLGSIDGRIMINWAFKKWKVMEWVTLT